MAAAIAASVVASVAAAAAGTSFGHMDLSGGMFFQKFLRRNDYTIGLLGASIPAV